jgi:hypothetical protein
VQDYAVDVHIHLFINVISYIILSLMNRSMPSEQFAKSCHNLMSCTSRAIVFSSFLSCRRARMKRNREVSKHVLRPIFSSHLIPCLAWPCRSHIPTGRPTTWRGVDPSQKAAPPSSKENPARHDRRGGISLISADHTRTHKHKHTQEHLLPSSRGCRTVRRYVGG